MVDQCCSILITERENRLPSIAKDLRAAEDSVPILYGPISCIGLSGEDRSYGRHALDHRTRTSMVVPPVAVSWLGDEASGFIIPGCSRRPESSVSPQCCASHGVDFSGTMRHLWEALLLSFTEPREAVIHWDSECPGSLLSAPLCSSRGHLCGGNLLVQAHSSMGPGTRQKSGGRVSLPPFSFKIILFLVFPSQDGPHRISGSYGTCAPQSRSLYNLLPLDHHGQGQSL